MPGFLQGAALYSPVSPGYSEARKLRRELFHGCRHFVRSPFQEFVSRSTLNGLLPHLLVGRIYVQGFVASRQKENSSKISSCFTQYYCGLRLIFGKDLLIVNLNTEEGVMCGSQVEILFPRPPCEYCRRDISLSAFRTQVPTVVLAL